MRRPPEGTRHTEGTVAPSPRRDLPSGVPQFLPGPPVAEAGRPAAGPSRAGSGGAGGVGREAPPVPVERRGAGSRFPPHSPTCPGGAPAAT